MLCSVLCGHYFISYLSYKTKSMDGVKVEVYRKTQNKNWEVLLSLLPSPPSSLSSLSLLGFPTAYRRGIYTVVGSNHVDGYAYPHIPTYIRDPNLDFSLPSPKYINTMFLNTLNCILQFSNLFTNSHIGRYWGPSSFLLL